MPIFTTRVKFDNANRGTSGGHRVGGLFADAAGDFSGTMALGGANGDGTVFDNPSIDGSDASTPASFDDTNGAYPDAGLIAAAGDLSGTTFGNFTNTDTDTAAAPPQTTRRPSPPPLCRLSPHWSASTAPTVQARMQV